MPRLELYALEVGGGTLGLTSLPGRGRNYAGDLGVLRAWAPTIVLSMTTAAEMRDLGAGRLGQDLSALGIEWIHLPVEDFGTPPPEICAEWPAVSRQVHEVLSQSGRVLVHCHGGCGRSGMVVLRLMTETGEAPAMALSRLRAIRPCAVETDAQMRWATAAQP